MMKNKNIYYGLDANSKRMIARINSRLKRIANRFGTDSYAYTKLKDEIETYLSSKGYYHSPERGNPIINYGDGAIGISRSKDISLSNRQLRALENIDKMSAKYMVSSQLEDAARRYPYRTIAEQLEWISKRDAVKQWLETRIEENYNENHEWEGDQEVYDFLKSSRADKEDTTYEEVYDILYGKKG